MSLVGGVGTAGMASSPCGGNFDCGLEIQTRSVEQTLIPLVSQVSPDQSSFTEGFIHPTGLENL